jgi:hypothetical protein
MRAAKVTIWRIVDATHTWLDLDLGSESLITKDWYAAIVDEQGRPVTEWVQLQHVGRESSEVVVSVGYEKIDRASTRVALVAERPQ